MTRYDTIRDESLTRTEKPSMVIISSTRNQQQNKVNRRN